MISISRTKNSGPDSIMPLQFELNNQPVGPDPFVFANWLKEAENSVGSSKFVFDKSHQMQVEVLFTGEHDIGLTNAETWIYQMVSSSFSGQCN